MSKKIIIMLFWCYTQSLTLFCTFCVVKEGEKLETEYDKIPKYPFLPNLYLT